MKIYVSDLRPGDKFDVVELIDRQGIALFCLHRGDSFANVATVTNVFHEFRPSYSRIWFTVNGITNDWQLEKDQVVEVVSLVS